jgi:hypothetical protein
MATVGVRIWPCRKGARMPPSRLGPRPPQARRERLPAHRRAQGEEKREAAAQWARSTVNQEREWGKWTLFTIGPACGSYTARCSPP